MIEPTELEVARLTLESAQADLHEARFLSLGVQPRTGPSMEYRRQCVVLAEELVKCCLDRLWAAQQNERGP
jgi:hypothetical protein